LLDYTRPLYYHSVQHGADMPPANSLLLTLRVAELALAPSIKGGGGEGAEGGRGDFSVAVTVGGSTPAPPAHVAAAHGAMAVDWKVSKVVCEREALVAVHVVDKRGHVTGSLLAPATLLRNPAGLIRDEWWPLRLAGEVTGKVRLRSLVEDDEPQGTQGTHDSAPDGCARARLAARDLAYSAAAPAPSIIELRCVSAEPVLRGAAAPRAVEVVVIDVVPASGSGLTDGDEVEVGLHFGSARRRSSARARTPEYSNLYYRFNFRGSFACVARDMPLVVEVLRSKGGVVFGSAVMGSSELLATYAGETRQTIVKLSKDGVDVGTVTLQAAWTSAAGSLTGAGPSAGLNGLLDASAPREKGSEGERKGVGDIFSSSERRRYLSDRLRYSRGPSASIGCCCFTLDLAAQRRVAPLCCWQAGRVIAMSKWRGCYAMATVLGAAAAALTFLVGVSIINRDGVFVGNLPFGVARDAAVRAFNRKTADWPALSAKVRALNLSRLSLSNAGGAAAALTLVSAPESVTVFGSPDGLEYSPANAAHFAGASGAALKVSFSEGLSGALTVSGAQSTTISGNVTLFWAQRGQTCYCKRRLATRNDSASSTSALTSPGAGAGLLRAPRALQRGGGNRGGAGESSCTTVCTPYTNYFRLARVCLVIDETGRLHVPRGCLPGLVQLGGAQLADDSPTSFGSGALSVELRHWADPAVAAAQADAGFVTRRVDAGVVCVVVGAVLFALACAFVRYRIAPRERAFELLYAAEPSPIMRQTGAGEVGVRAGAGSGEHAGADVVLANPVPARRK
jgi:hypothetical protein